MAKITVTVDTQGKSTISVDGANGKQCLDLTKELEKSLGTVTNRQETEEMKGGKFKTQHKRENRH